MRRVWLAPLLVAVALILQLTVIDGLHLPRGGEPDLVLVLVVALAMAGGPVPGMVTGFAAGFCVDIAPPGAPFIGQYALVFCLAGWAAGSLGRRTRRSPLRAIAVAAVVIAGAELLVVVIGKALGPDQVSVAEIRQFLPITIAYDLVICPFVLYLVILAATSGAGRGVADSVLAGTGMLSVPARSKAARKRRTHEPRLNPAAASSRDGWVGGGPGRHPGGKRSARRGTRLHPGAGVPGSASGYAAEARLPVRPVKLRLSAGARGTRAIGSVVGGAVGGAEGRRWQPGRHPGLQAGAGHQIRFRGERGGAAARQHAPAAPGPRPLRIDFRGRLGGSVARSHAPTGPRRRPLRINFGAHSGASIGDGQGASWRAAPKRPSPAVPRLRMGASRSALTPAASIALTRSVPTLHFRTVPRPIARRAVAAPKFRRRSGPLRASALTTGLVAGGALEQSTFRARRTAIGPARLRLSGRGHGQGMLGGSGVSTLRRPPARARKQPRFGYGRRSLLRFLSGRRRSGRWLTKMRAGCRSGPGLIGKRTGGLR
ncbi:MAG TPA: rod shape-determining protein MreD [Streptosporangiaceae bacterium]|nr:rod shape-determining protein MreD [Streptosporangiaceae bacterium]